MKEISMSTFNIFQRSGNEVLLEAEGGWEGSEENEHIIGNVRKT